MARGDGVECGGGAVVGGTDGAAWWGNFEKWGRFRGRGWAGRVLVSKEPIYEYFGWREVEGEGSEFVMIRRGPGESVEEKKEKEGKEERA